MVAMSTDAKWTVGTAIALATLLVTLMMSQHSGITARLDSMESRLDSIESRLLSIEEPLRAAPAAALPEHP